MDFDREASPLRHQSDMGSSDAFDTPNFDADGARMAFPNPGGALHGLGHDFSADSLTGAATFSTALPDRPVRQSAGHGLGLSYQSAGGPGLFGHGWRLGLETIYRDTRKSVPLYDKSDMFTLGGQQLVLAEGPMPEPVKLDGFVWQRRLYLPRVEGNFARIEYWEKPGEPRSGHWRVITGNNVTTVYGQSDACRIADPDAPERVAEWLAERRYDAFGNLVVFEYKPEDLAGIPRESLSEAARLRGVALFENRHLKRVHWGTKTPYRPDAALPDFLFELVLDYGEHTGDVPSHAERQDWALRPDPFSDRRAGFDKRCNRLCQRAILFHKFPELGDDPVVVSSLSFRHELRAGLSVVSEIAGKGYGVTEGGADRIGTTPPLTFVYEEDRWEDTPRQIELGALNASSGAPLFARLDPGPLAGLLIPHDGGLGFARNLGDGQFGAVRPMPALPTHLANVNEPVMLQNLEGTPQLHAVRYASGGACGFASFDENTGAEESWSAFRAFDGQPNIDLRKGQARFVDLTGDGRPDLLFDEGDALGWFRSLGTEGFVLGGRTSKRLEAEDGPRLVLQDREEALFVADMTGDGLPDLVRIRAGTVSYWPNLGHGRFGARIDMADSPRLGPKDHFDARLCRLADLDGTGTADLVWLGDAIQIYRNYAGNGFASAPVILRGFGTLDGLARLDILDLTGSGTVDFVRSDMRAARCEYIDPLEGRRPHVMIGYDNNQGLSTRVRYSTSVEMQRRAEAEGRPWVTNLPIVVSCVERIETTDHISGRSAAQVFSYAHGAYDYHEREFRGFARIDQLDTEVFEAEEDDPASYQPPVLSRRWMALGLEHLGFAPLDLHAPYVHEFYGDTSFQEPRPAAQRTAADWSAEDRRAALYASRGAVLRMETYGLDGTNEAGHPYAVEHHVHEVKRLQAPGEDAHAAPGVFQALHRETVTHVLDRNPSDPRVSHQLVLARGDFGQPTRSAEVIYPRRAPPPDLPPEVAQDHQRLEITIGEAGFTEQINETRDYRLPRAHSHSRWVLATAPLAGTALFDVETLNERVDDAQEIELHQPETLGSLRLIRRSETDFLADDLTGPLPHGQLGRLGLTHCSYALAWSDPLSQELFSTAQRDEIDFADLGYVQRKRADQWWQPSGTILFEADAASHFYLATAARDAMGRVSRREYDKHDLLIRVSLNALDQRIEAELDYRHLSPAVVTDINGNRMAGRLDPLGRVEAIAFMGREGDGEGDSLDDPSLRLRYDTGRWLTSGAPAMTIEERRQTIGDPDSEWRVQHSFYSGAGGLWQTKTRDEPGEALSWDDDLRSFVTVDTGASPRWITTGANQVTNKGLTVRAWEPFYSDSEAYLDAESLLQIGTSGTRHYDPLGRQTRLETAEGTITKSEFTPWQNRQHDANDTVLESAWFAARGAPDPAGAMPGGGAARAAWLAAQHSGTYATVHVGLTGTPVAAIAHLPGQDVTTARLDQPLRGFSEHAFDAQDREIFSARKNYLGATVTSQSAERPGGTVVQSAAGEAVLSWSGAARRFRTLYDDMGRAIGLYERVDGTPERLSQLTLYGDAHPLADTRRLKGHVFAVFDDSGATFTDSYDMMGAPMEIRRRLLVGYKSDPDWSAVLAAPTPDVAETIVDADLSAEAFTSQVLVDALGQMQSARLPGGDRLEFGHAVSGRTTTLSLTPHGAGARPMVTGSDANALGQITRLSLANGIELINHFDPNSHRLTHRQCLRSSDGRLFQDARFEYDPLGNIVEHDDAAQESSFFNNTVTSALKQFQYDAFNRLVRATGRESAALAAGPPDHGQAARAPIPHQNDTHAVRAYVETYDYDLNNNITKMRHFASGANWTRHYRYARDLDPSDRTNRLMAVSAHGEAEGGVYSHQFTYDEYGVMTSMPHLAALRWTAHDKLREVDLGGGGRMYHRYGADGTLVRKVIERPGALRSERIYLGNTEIFRRYRNDALVEERRTVFVTLDGMRIAQLDIQVLDEGTPANAGSMTTQFAVDTVSGAASVTFDELGQCIGFEEFHPFGTTAYWSGRSETEASLRRYRWLARERDADTGLIRIGMRHYAPWLGRWVTADPQGVGDGMNLYAFANCNPISRRDVNGMQSNGEEEEASSEGTTTISHTLPERLQSDLTNPDAAAGQRLHDWLNGQVVQRDDGLYRIDVTGMKYKDGRWSATSTRTQVAITETDPQTGETITRSIAQPEEGAEQTPAEGGEGTTQDAQDDSTTAGLYGGGLTATHPGFENSLWNFDGRLRGLFIDDLAGNNLGTMAKDADQVIGQLVLQVKSTDTTNVSGVRTIVRLATEAATRYSDSRTTNPGSLIPQAEIVVPRDTPDEIIRAMESTFDSPASYGGVNTGARPRPTTSAGVDALNPRVSRGMPSRMRFFGPGMAVAGGALSTYALYDDYQRGDAAMGFGDALGVAGGGVELAAFARSSTTLLKGGGVLAGAAVAWTSGVRSYRAFAEGDTESGLVNALGVVGGGMLIAAALVTGPWLAAGLLIGGSAITLGVALYNLGHN